MLAIPKPNRTQSDRDRFGLWLRYVKIRSETDARNPRAWRPMRFAQQDWVLSAWVYRSTRQRYDISLFLTEDHTRFVRDSGTMAGLVFNLSEAYDKTGGMEIRFVGPPDGRVGTVLRLTPGEPAPYFVPPALQVG